MLDDKILIKGNRHGIILVIKYDKFKNFKDMLDALREKLENGKRFYKDASFKVLIDLALLDKEELDEFKSVMFEEYLIKECIFEENQDKEKLENGNSKFFSGVYEGKTKFIRKTVRGGQRIEYSGNVIVIGDVNSGAEICAGGNVIVLGTLKGNIQAGIGGNDKAIIAAFSLQPQIMGIAGVLTRAPEDESQTMYPEVAKIKDGGIIVEPYLVNKYI